MSEPETGHPLWLHVNKRCPKSCPYCDIAKLQAINAELEEGNRLAVAEAYRCGFEAGKVESDLWGEAAATIKELEAELDTFRDASLLLTGKLEDAEAELAELRECCQSLTLEPVDAGGHMQCVSCTKLAGREGDLRSVLARRTAALDEAHKAVNEAAALRKAAREHLEALMKKQYSTDPPVPWPDIAPTANKLASLLQGEQTP